MDEPERGTVRRFAVLFREGDNSPVPGSLEIEADRLVFAGGVGGARGELAVGLADVVAVTVGRLPGDRLAGYRTLVVERRAPLPPVRVAPLSAGLLWEIADLLEELTREPHPPGQELALVVPLEPGCLERARELLVREPPFDPGSLGLSGHRVYLREHEVLFVFSGADVRARLGTLVRTPALWRAGIAWQECIAGRPRVRRQAHLDTEGETPAYTWPPSAETSTQP